MILFKLVMSKMYARWFTSMKRSKECAYCNQCIKRSPHVVLYSERHEVILFHNQCYYSQSHVLSKYVMQSCKFCNKTLKDGSFMIHVSGESVICSRCSLGCASEASNMVVDTIQARLLRDALLALRKDSKHTKTMHKIIQLKKSMITQGKLLCEYEVGEEIINKWYDELCNMESVYESLLLGFLKAHVMRSVHDELLAYVWHPDRCDTWKWLDG